MQALRSFFMKDKEKTFKPKVKFSKDTKRYSLHKQSKARLGTLKADSVKLPAGESLNDWLAVHVVDFYNCLSLLYGSLEEVCTDESCPVMCAGPKYEYLWMDKTMREYRKPVRVSAPVYIRLMMEWVEKQLEDESVFPSDPDVPFPKNFMDIVKNIFKRMFRVYAHAYYQHFEKIQHLGQEAHVNTSFTHFVLFVLEFHLVERRELEPLAVLINKFLGSASPFASHGSSKSA